MMNAASKRAKRARNSRNSKARDTESATSICSTLDESRHQLQQSLAETSTTVRHIKYDAGSYEGSDEARERDQLGPGQTANGTNFTNIQVPEGAPVDLVCEECERRNAVGYCEDCSEVLCAACLAILHIPGTGGQAHAHLAQDGIRTLRAGDESTVMQEDEDPIPAHEIDEEEMATRRDLSVPTSLEAPTIDLTSRTSKRNAAEALHTKGQLVVFKAAAADCLPDHLAADEEEREKKPSRPNGQELGRLSWRTGSRPQELYGEVMSVPLARHGEWGHAGRRMQGHCLLVRVKILGRASGGYSDPFVEEWLRQKHRREGPREPVKITGGGGPDPLAREINAAKAKDMRRDDVRRTLVPPEKELPLPLGRCSQTCDIGTKPDLVVDRDRQQQHQQPLVVLVAEDQLFTIEAKREVLRKNRLAAIEACCARASRRQSINMIRAALKRWNDTAVEIQKARWAWASQVLQRRARGIIVRSRLARQREAEEKALWEAGRRLHKQFRYLDTQELRDNAGGGVTTNGRVFVRTKAELNRLEALRRVMAEKSYRMLCKGVYHAKARAFKHWLSHTEWERRENETYVFSVAKDTSLAMEESTDGGPCKTDWRHPSHGLSLPPLPRVHSGRPGAKMDPQAEKSGPVSAEASAAASESSKIGGPAPFCSWLMPGSVLMSSYIDSESRARPRDFKQPLYPEAASQIMLAGVGTLICLSSKEAVRQHEADHGLPKFDQAFGVCHKIISASIKSALGEAKHEVMILRQEEKNFELLRSVEGYDPEERRKSLADIVGRMRIARSAYTIAKRTADLFPPELKVVWEPIKEDEAPGVDEVIELAVRLEDRLRAGEKLCLWSPRGHGRVGLVGAVLLGRLYGFTADDALLRVQVSHDARESLRGQPQISCPQTIAQVQCVREALLQMASMYTDLIRRADLPASKRAVKICRCIRGQGPPALSLRQVDHVPDETQAARYEREKEQIRQVARIQDDHRPRLLLSSPRATTTKATTTATASTRARAQQPGNMQVLGRGATRFGIPGRKEDTGHDREADGNSSTSGALPPRKLVTLASYTGRMATGEASNGNGNSDGFGIAMPPASLGKSCPIRRPVSLSRDGDTDADRARAVAAVPYPTLRSLRKS